MSIIYQNIEFFETNYVGYFVSKCGKIFSEKTKKILKHKIDKAYLNCLIDGTTNSFYMFFDKNDNGIDVYWNGEIFLHFNSIKETAEYFKLKRNSVSTKINHHKPVEYVTKNYKISINFK